jgi:hypothetical protein
VIDYQQYCHGFAVATSPGMGMPQLSLEYFVEELQFATERGDGLVAGWNAGRLDKLLHPDDYRDTTS